MIPRLIRKLQSLTFAVKFFRAIIFHIYWFATVFLDSYYSKMCIRINTGDVRRFLLRADFYPQKFGAPFNLINVQKKTSACGFLFGGNITQMTREESKIIKNC